jgi:hypothetical protein
MDREQRRLFVGCRNPARLIVMNADTGKVIASQPIGGNNDGVIFANGNVYASCGDGTFSILRENAPGKYETVEVVKTRPGARTMGFDPNTEAFYLPTADFEPRKNPNADPELKPNTFVILVLNKA